MAIQVTSINNMGGVNLSTGATTGMTANDHMYASEDLIYSAGCRNINDTGVTENSPNGKSVVVPALTYYVKNVSFVENSNAHQKYFRAVNDGNVVVNITDNTSGNPRKDLICIKVDSSATPGDNAENSASFVAIAGTPAVTPAEPNIPADGNHYEILAVVDVANGFSSISNSEITDRREQATTIWSGGWISVNDTTNSNVEAYPVANATSGSYDVWISNIDLTDYIKKGTKISLKENDVQKYFYVTNTNYNSGSTRTELEIYAGDDYTLGSGTIRDLKYSNIENPKSFPENGFEISLSDSDILGSGSMTVTSLTNTINTFKMSNNTIEWFLALEFTIGGTANRDIYIVNPTKIDGFASNPDQRGACTISTNGQSLSGYFFCRNPGSGHGIYFRRYDQANWTVGAGAIYGKIEYRI